MTNDPVDANMVGIVAAALLSLIIPARALAHSAPIPIAIWGGFKGDLVTCQRAVAHNAATCALTAWSARATCWEARVRGESCDDAATDAVIEAAHTSALAAAESACQNANIMMLGYNTMVDLDIDVDIFCQQLEDAMVSAVFGPVVRGAAIDDAARACVLFTSDAADRVLRAAFRERRSAFDRIASVPLTPSRKFALVQASVARITRERQILQGRVTARCPSFKAIYGQNVAPFLTLITQRADCLCGRVYVQDYVQCPSAVCGNGMREPTEACDDGNAVSGDGCDESCQNEP